MEGLMKDSDDTNYTIDLEWSMERVMSLKSTSHFDWIYKYNAAVNANKSIAFGYLEIERLTGVHGNKCKRNKPDRFGYLNLKHQCRCRGKTKETVAFAFSGCRSAA